MRTADQVWSTRCQFILWSRRSPTAIRPNRTISSTSEPRSGQQATEHLQEARAHYLASPAPIPPEASTCAKPFGLRPGLRKHQPNSRFQIPQWSRRFQHDTRGMLCGTGQIAWNPAPFSRKRAPLKLEAEIWRCFVIRQCKDI
jgi:hypothetical protein